jgi:hypothetical protein
MVEDDALRELATFPLVDALYGRRSRRFALGEEIPDGPLAYRSKHEPLPLTELERLLVVSAIRGPPAGTTRLRGTSATLRTPRTTPAGAAGRTFPSYCDECLIPRRGSEDRDRDCESFEELVEQSALLPTGAVLSAQGNQNMIGGEPTDGILEGDQRVVAADGSACLRTDLVELTEH